MTPDQILPDIPRIYTALAEWSSCVVLVLLTKSRLPKMSRFPACILALILQCIYQQWIGTLATVLWIPGMVGAVALMFFTIFTLCDLPIKALVICCVWAFILAEFAASFEWQIYCFFLYGKNNGLLIEILLLVVTYSFVLSIVYLIEQKITRHEPDNKELVFTIFIGISVFTISNISFIHSNTPFSSRSDFDIFIVRTLVDLAGLILLYAYYIQRSDDYHSRELATIEMILQNNYRQYQMSKDNIDALNLKYHDLKNQIALIRNEPDALKKEKYIAEMENGIRIHESMQDTGNRIVDTVLTSKGLLCAEKGIELTCVANGKLLDFMDATDICSILGNALDNAIEYESKVLEQNKRIINVSIYARDELLMIRIENYFMGEFSELIDGLPKSTKQDSVFHGYGMKSIRYSAKKYNGTISFKKSNNWFQLNVLIPTPQNGTDRIDNAAW